MFFSGKSLEANPWKEYETDDACEIEERIDFEDALLIERMKAFARAARDLSDSAVSESQQLLQLFGIPFIVSPQVGALIYWVVQKNTSILFFQFFEI